MKTKHSLLSILLFINLITQAQTFTVPDVNFFNALLDPNNVKNISNNTINCSICVNNYTTRVMRAGCIDSLNITYLSLMGKNINSLEGIVNFLEVETLDCRTNQLTSLPTLPSSLTILNYSNNQLITLPTFPSNLQIVGFANTNIQTTGFPILPSSLQWLDCSNNGLTSIPTLSNNITVLNYSNNPLSTTPILPINLQQLDCSGINLSIIGLPNLPSTLDKLYCSNNQLTSLPTLPNSLTYIDCSVNNINTLPSLPINLNTLYCNNNQLISLPTLPNSLNYLWCYENQLTNLPTLPNSLLNLWCDKNQLTKLPTLPNTLVGLSCDSNQIATLPILPNSLGQLSCHSNPLTSLPILPSSLTSLDCYNTLLTCFPNIKNITLNLSMNISKTNITCHPIIPSNITITPTNLPLCANNYTSPCDYPYATYGVEVFPYQVPRKIETTIIDLPFTTTPNDTIQYEHIQFQNQDWAVLGSDIMLCPISQLNTFHANTWNGKIPYDATTVSDSIMKAINYWNVRASLMGLHIAFVPKQASDTQWIKFIHTPNAFASRLGRVDNLQEQEIWVDTLGFSGRILHELAHTAGMYHEHQRWDRDNYVNIIMNKIRAEYADNYYKIHDIQTTPFDYQSIMHHWCYAFSSAPPIDARNINPDDCIKTIIPLNNMGEGVIMGQRADFTYYDIQDINQLYPTGIMGGIDTMGTGIYTLELANNFPAYDSITWYVWTTEPTCLGNTLATIIQSNELKIQVVVPQDSTSCPNASRGFVIAIVNLTGGGTKSFYKYVFKN